ncbi:MAG: glycosyltransferase [Clostridia bacterium]|nr:glycosyltransferase [Clostridia bacterium]MDD4386495.1 glycosyltransferase [Clostridia bacterium]
MIRIIHYGLSSNRGGIETYINKLYTNIDRSKFQFDFINMNIEKPCFYDEFTKLGSKFYNITPRKISISKNKDELEKLFRKEKFDVLHCHLNTLSYVEPIYVALRHGCKVVVHSRSSSSKKNILAKILHNINSFRLPKNKIKMLAVSKLAGNWLFGNDLNFTVINNGVEIDKFTFSKNARNKLREELNIKNKFVIGHVGVFLPVKNHKFLIKIFKDILDKKENAVLLLIGGGPMKNKMINMAKKMKIDDKIYFLGMREDVAQLMSAMDCFIFPSFYEGFPNVVLEAQTSGLTCLISNKITNEVILSENCISFPLSCSSNEWANKLLTLPINQNRIFESEIIKKLGFSVNEEIDKIGKIYTDLISQ